MRIFVTGATGFIGSHLVKRLVERGDTVAILKRPTSNTSRIKDILGKVEVIHGDLSSIDTTSYSVKRFAPESIVHLAWWGVSNASRNDPRQVGNIGGAVSLAQIADWVGARNWIGLGSQAEYGPNATQPVTENATPQPTSLYGITKLSASLLAKHFCSTAGLRFAWVRLFSAYGPCDEPDWLIPYVIRNLLANKRPALSLGEQRWDYLYIDDAIDGLIKIIDEPTASGTFNLGSGCSPTIVRVAETIRDIIDPSLPLGLGDIPYSPNQIMHLQADISRLRSLGWESKISLVEGLHRTIEWFRKNPQ